MKSDGVRRTEKLCTTLYFVHLKEDEKCGIINKRRKVERAKVVSFISWEVVKVFIQGKVKESKIEGILKRIADGRHVRN